MTLKVVAEILVPTKWVSTLSVACYKNDVEGFVIFDFVFICRIIHLLVLTFLLAEY